MEQHSTPVEKRLKDIQGKKVLVVDDDAIMRRLVEQVIIRAGHKLYTAENGTDGLHKFYAHQPDLVVLDVKMPTMSGWEVCRHIRQFSTVPIIMLTAKGSERDVIRGLDEGADDYVTKPFNANILQARIQAALRRGEMLASEDKKQTTYSDDYLTLDLSRRCMLVGGKGVKLTATEYRLLCYLFQYAGQTLTFRQILENVWGWEYRDNTDYVHVYIWHLRKKLEKDPKSPMYILTEHGVGYRFEKVDDPEQRSASVTPKMASQLVC